MASQTKITGFYRPTKPNSSVASAKRRKAVIDHPAVKQESDHETKSTVVGDQSDTICKREIEPPVLLKSEPLKTEPELTGNTKNIFTVGIELGKSTQKKASERKLRKTKSIQSSMKKYISGGIETEQTLTLPEIIKEETTSFSDNHGNNPSEVSTPKGPGGLSESSRKRKMQCIEEQAEVISQTPEKTVEKKRDVEVTKKFRKKLDMGNDKNPVNQILEDVKSNADLLKSPSKQVSFLCMGPLSPRKPGVQSPVRSLSSPSHSRKILSSSEKMIQNLAEKSFKSPAVKSLASLLDKVPSTKVL